MRYAFLAVLLTQLLGAFSTDSCEADVTAALKEEGPDAAVRLLQMKSTEKGEKVLADSVDGDGRRRNGWGGGDGRRRSGWGGGDGRRRSGGWGGDGRRRSGWGGGDGRRRSGWGGDGRRRNGGGYNPYNPYNPFGPHNPYNPFR